MQNSYSISICLLIQIVTITRLERRIKMSFFMLYMIGVPLGFLFLVGLAKIVNNEY